MKQTAVEWFWRWMMDNPFGSFDDGVKAYNQAKAIEKEQIINSYISGDLMEGRANLIDAEQYYNQTYNQNP